MVLARDDGGVQHARDAVLRFLGDELPVTFIRDAVLLTGELASNAIAHSVGQCGLEASFSVALGKLRVEITDQSSEMPSLSTAEPFGRAAGMGLQLVAEVASEWGAISLVSGGKLVWFELTIHPL